MTKEAIDACELTGINPNDLYEKNLDYFMQSAADPEIAQMRHEHFERRRKDKLSIVLSQINEMSFKYNIIQNATA